ncbi:MAG: hypothetical protein AB1750_03040 [Chloroflexota bacterium]
MKSTKPTDWPTLLLLIALLFGALVRFMPALVTRFPINDGGMFLDMTRDLQANHYLLPATTSYNGLDLPYAYPPLGFYLTSLLADLTRAPLLDLFTWLPALLASLSIPAFYLFALAVLNDKLRASLATIFFALTPGAYGWHIMGGGITRSLGLIFLLLGARQVLILFRGKSQNQEILESGATKRSAKSPDFAPDLSENSIRENSRTFADKALAILFCSLAVLSHPEIAIQTAGLCALAWLFFGRTKRGTLHASLVAMGVLLLTAPWWGTVLAQHGATPFLAASQTGLHASASWLKFFTEGYAPIGVFPFLLLLRLLGTGYTLLKKNWFFVAALLLPYLVDPRSAPSISFLVFNLISSQALLDALPALFAKLKKSPTPPRSLLETRAGVILLFALIFLQFVDCGLNNYRLINTTLTPADRAAMQWIRDNIPPGQNFLLVTGRPYSMSDPAQEWFPTLSGGRSQSTLQGLEWTLASGFMPRLTDLSLLQACADLACVESWSTRVGLEYEYLWVTVSPEMQTSLLTGELLSADDYKIAYESETIFIFERK